MLVRAVAVARWNSDTEDAIILDAAYNLAEYSFFQRGRCARRLPRRGGDHSRCGPRERGAHFAIRIITVPAAPPQQPPARLCSVKEFLNFAIKTLMKRLSAGVQCVDYEGACPRGGGEAATLCCAMRRHFVQGAGPRQRPWAAAARAGAPAAGWRSLTPPPPPPPP
jgi:hypothetical protein